MAKKTLLELTQDVLNNIDGDEVNSIEDTIESSQVALVIKNVYLAMMSSRNWPHTRKLVQLIPSGDDTRPTHMTFPTSYKEISLINYDKARITDGTRRKFEEVQYIDQDDFLRISNRRNNTQANYDSVVDPGSLITLTIRNDSPPQYCTSFDDKSLVFDSYDKAVDDTLQKSKTQAYVYTIPDWVHDDDFIPDLPEEAFALLVAESTSEAAVKIRQQPDQKAEQQSGKQNRWLARKSWTVAGGIKKPNYGRHGARNYRDPTFDRNN
jgi:hypothetical protein